MLNRGHRSIQTLAWWHSQPDDPDDLYEPYTLACPSSGWHRWCTSSARVNHVWELRKRPSDRLSGALLAISSLGYAVDISKRA